MRRSCHPCRGFAVVELLLAAAILAVCAVPICAGVNYLRRNAAEAEVQSEVLSGVRSVLNQQLDAGKLTKLIASVTPTTTTQTLGAGTTVTYTLTTSAVSGYRSLFALTCTATWPSVSTVSRNDSISLTMYAIS